jgi:hypothetical protein
MLIWEKEDSACFGYIPGQKTEVHNANLMAAAFLSRFNQNEDNPRIRRLVEKSLHFSLNDMREDGFWPYGTRSHHRWMDNFHTAFNIEALLTIRKYEKTRAYDPPIKKALSYFLKSFFTLKGMPKYYSDHQYPIDIHTIAVDIICLTNCLKDASELLTAVEREHLQLRIDQLLQLAAGSFWDKRGYFYYQKHRMWTNKTPYIRWSQAWMFYALTTYLKSQHKHRHQGAHAHETAATH